MLSVERVDLYYGASYALRRVSLTAKKGEVTCVLGRNGVGKTSLLRAIFGLQPIRAGRITWEGRVLNDLPPHKRARRVGPGSSGPRDLSSADDIREPRDWLCTTGPRASSCPR